MGNSRLGWILSLAVIAPAVLAQAPRQGGRPQPIQPESWQLVVLANQARAAQGARPLKWDPALAEAARQHCLRMAAEGPISHQYRGEPDEGGRAGQAGAHFSLIEENVAVASNLALVHQGWMESPGHRANLLNPEVDHVGVAVVASRGMLYAVADYERAVPVLTQARVEATIANLVRAQGIVLLADTTAARAYCAQSRGARGGSQPGFSMLWQDADLSRLPKALVGRIASGQYRQAAVGSCPPQGQEGSFTAYRVAVLLY
jgi:hypothetical protein